MQNTKRTVCLEFELANNVSDDIVGTKSASSEGLRFITTADSMLQVLKDGLNFYKQHKDVITSNIQYITVYAPIDSAKQQQLQTLYKSKSSDNKFKVACDSSYDLAEDLYKSILYEYAFNYTEAADIAELIINTEKQDSEVILEFGKWDLAITTPYI